MEADLKVGSYVLNSAKRYRAAGGASTWLVETLFIESMVRSVTPRAPIRPSMLMS